MKKVSTVEQFHRRSLTYERAAVRVAKARGSVLFTTVARHYRVNAVVNMFTVLSMSIGLFVSNMTRVNSAGGLVMSLLLLQSGIHDVVLACQVLHDHLSKRMRDN